MRPFNLHAHSRPVTWVKFNTDGDLLISSGKEGQVFLWQVETGRCLGCYDIEKGTVWNFDITNDSQYLIVASATQRVVIFNVESGEKISEMVLNASCRFVEWNHEPLQQRKFVLAKDSFLDIPKSISVWEVTDTFQFMPKPLWVKEDFATRCSHLHWGPFDQTIISCHDSGEIMVWDADNGKRLRLFQAHKENVTCADFTKDRLLMLTASSDCVAKLWDTVDFINLKIFSTDRPLNACGISPLYSPQNEMRRCHILVGGGQEADKVTQTAASEGKFETVMYHLVYCEEVGSIKGHFGTLNTLAWNPNGNGFASGGEDGYVRIYHLDDNYFTDRFA